MKQLQILPVIIAFLTLIGLSSLALADSDFSAIKQNVQLLMSENKVSEALSYLSSKQSEFPDDSEFDYLMGVAAIAAGDLPLAQNALERVVLRTPNYAGAWLDLAIVYYRLGDIVTTKQILNHIEENFETPDTLKTQILDVKKKLERPTITDGWRLNVMGLVGYVKNANFGINSSSFQLTPLGSPPIEVIVAENSRPKASTATEIRLEAYKMISHEGNAKSELQVFARDRHYYQVENQNLTDLGAYWIFSKPLNASWDLSSGVSLRNVMLDGRQLATFASLLSGFKLKVNRCTIGIRAEYERRHFNDDQIHANIPWLGGSFSCPYENITLDAQYRYGIDMPEGERIGGKTIRQETSLQARWNPNNNIQVRGLIYIADYKDNEGYSQLLDNNASRHVWRKGQRIELDWLLPQDKLKGWMVHLEADSVNNSSNIEVVEFKDKQIFFGLRYQIF